MKEKISLRAHFNARIRDLRKSITEARETMDKRLDGMNEFPDSLRDQAGKFATKEQVSALDKLIQELRVTGGGNAAREAALTKYIGWVIAAIAIAVAWFK